MLAEEIQKEVRKTIDVFDNLKDDLRSQDENYISDNIKTAIMIRRNMILNETKEAILKK